MALNIPSINRRAIEYDEEALKTPLSRAYLCPKTEQIWSFTMHLGYSIDVPALKEAFSKSIMLKHPRFCSLMVKDHKGDHWIRTQVKIDDHFVIKNFTGRCDDEKEAALNEYLADLAVSCPLSKDKPLWEVHVLLGLDCVVLRCHHAIGDGVSMMSMFSSCFSPKNDSSEARVSSNRAAPGKKKWIYKELCELFKTIWLTILFTLRSIGRLLWVKDNSVISGGDGVELWPRKLVTTMFKLDDLKSVKKVIPNVTINDVLLGIISSGLSKYLHTRSPDGMLQAGIKLSALIAVNLRKEKLPDLSELMSSKDGSSSQWGNKTGFVVVPMLCVRGLHPLVHVKKMKAIMDQKKQSYEAQLIDIGLRFITSLFGPKVACWCSYKMSCNTSLLISNIMGPPKEMAIGNNPVSCFKANISSLPQALVMHMVSYEGNAELQIMVAKDLIPDPETLRNCFEESLLDLMESLRQEKMK